MSSTAAAPSFTLVIKKPSDFIKVRNTITLIYGQPGARKTSYAGTAPNPISFDFDDGMERVDEDYRSDFVPAEALRNWSEVEAQLGHEALAGYDTFIFDSVTKLLDYMSDFAMKKDLKNKKSGGGLSLQGYGALGEIFKSFLAKLQMMNKNIVFVAHDKESKDGDSTKLRPDIIGGSLGFVTRAADMIGYIELVNNESVVQFTPTDRFYAKNSCGIEPQFATSKYSLTQVIEKYKLGVNAKSAENKIYKAAMNNGLVLLETATDADKLNESFTEMTKMEHALTSKSELFGAYKEHAETLECYFDRNTKKFKEFDKAEIEAETTQQADTTNDGQEPPAEAPYGPTMAEEAPKPDQQENEAPEAKETEQLATKPKNKKDGN